MRALLALAAALLLSGCDWVSFVPLYTPADSVQPLQPGQYRVSDAARAVPVVRVIILDNGLTRMPGNSPGEEPTTLGFIALDDSGQRFLAWLEPEGPPTETPQARMFLLAERSGGDFLFYAPDCEARNAELTVAAGGRIEADGRRRACIFDSRQSLESAMRQAVIGRDRLIVRLTRSDG